MSLALTKQHLKERRKFDELYPTASSVAQQLALLKKQRTKKQNAPASSAPAISTDPVSEPAADPEVKKRLAALRAKRRRQQSKAPSAKELERVRKARQEESKDRTAHSLQMMLNKSKDSETSAHLSKQILAKVARAAQKGDNKQATEEEHDDFDDDDLL